MVIPCIAVRTEGLDVTIRRHLRVAAAGVWSFMLAARAPRPGTGWTTLHLTYERRGRGAARHPGDDHAGSAHPVAHAIGTDFKRAPRRDLSRIVHHDSW